MVVLDPRLPELLTASSAMPCGWQLEIHLPLTNQRCLSINFGGLQRGQLNVSILSAGTPKDLCSRAQDLYSAAARDRRQLSKARVIDSEEVVRLKDKREGGRVTGVSRHSSQKCYSSKDMGDLLTAALAAGSSALVSICSSPPQFHGCPSSALASAGNCPSALDEASSNVLMLQ